MKLYDRPASLAVSVVVGGWHRTRRGLALEKQVKLNIQNLLPSQRQPPPLLTTMNGQMNGFHNCLIDEDCFLFTSESVGEGHPGKNAHTGLASYLRTAVMCWTQLIFFLLITVCSCLNVWARRTQWMRLNIPGFSFQMTTVNWAGF